MITIRTGTVEDIDAVLALWKIATTVPSATDDAAGIEQLLSFAPDGLVVAFDGDTLVGTVIALFDGWRGAMYRLAVTPSHRRRGIATQLSEEGERQLRRTRCPAPPHGRRTQRTTSGSVLASRRL